jgi:Cupin-like domain
MQPIQSVDVQQISGAAAFHREIVEPCRPVVLRNLISAWPAVHAATRSDEDLRDYLLRFDSGGQADAFVGERSIAGKYYYRDGLEGFNFERRRMTFAGALNAMLSTKADATAPTMYLGSLPAEEFLPGFSAQNVLGVLPAHIAARIWVGHPSNVSAHFDAFDNLACVVAGQRRFTLYAPESIDRLYVGPLDHTMAGQPVSLAAGAPMDDERFPRFHEVRDQALIAELGPGDGIYIPKLWWHQVESLAAFNVLVNYWWDAFAVGPDAPYVSLLLSMIAISERPLAERESWKAYFDHYVFRTQGHPLRHLPESQHGLLGPLKPDNYGKIRAIAMHRMRGGT